MKKVVIETNISKKKKYYSAPSMKKIGGLGKVTQGANINNLSVDSCQPNAVDCFAGPAS